MQLVRTHTYKRSLKRLRASQADVQVMERNVAGNPLDGDVIPGLGGVRKARFAMQSKGKSGGGRVIYYAVLADDTVIMLLAYAKSAQSDLTAAQKKLIAALVKELMR